MWAKHKQPGFTIVELLIVIVVIGILAAITIVAYNGVQQRARNAQVISGVKVYVQALMSYSTVNTTYPMQAGCLGANYPGNLCWQGVSGTFGTNGTVDANLASFMSTKPTLASNLMSIGIADNMRAGAIYFINPSRIIYYLSGAGQPCVIAGSSGVTEGGVVTQCAFSLP